MKILKSYKKMMMEFINEEDDNDSGEGRIDMDDPVMQKTGWSKKNPDLTVGGVLKQGEKHSEYKAAKAIVDKEKGGGEEPEGGDLGSGDFERDSNKDDYDQKSKDTLDKMKPSDVKTKKKYPKFDPSDYEDEDDFSVAGAGDPGDVGIGELPDRSKEGGVEGPSPEDDDWNSETVMTAKLDGEEVGDIIDKGEEHPNYDKAMDYVSQFDPDDEKLYTGTGGDEPSDSPEDRLEKIDSEIAEIEDQQRILKQHMKSPYGVSRNARDKYERQEKELLAKWRELKQARMALDPPDWMADDEEEQEESVKVINGKKYKAVKESKKPNKRVLKENYDRIFRSRK